MIVDPRLSEACIGRAATRLIRLTPVTTAALSALPIV